MRPAGISFDKSQHFIGLLISVGPEAAISKAQTVFHSLKSTGTDSLPAVGPIEEAAACGTVACGTAARLNATSFQAGDQCGRCWSHATVSKGPNNVPEDY